MAFRFANASLEYRLSRVARPIPLSLLKREFPRGMSLSTSLHRQLETEPKITRTLRDELANRASHSAAR